MLLSLVVLPALAVAQYSTYPSVRHSASINGFADYIYDQIPSCAKSCVTHMNTGICPYWDTGCLCVLTDLTSPVAECVASQCEGSNVSSFTYLANSLCSSVGAKSWFLDGSDESAITSAQAKAAVGVSSSGTPTSVPASTTAAGSSKASGVASTTSPSSTVEAGSDSATEVAVSVTDTAASSAESTGSGDSGAASPEQGSSDTTVGSANADGNEASSTAIPTSSGTSSSVPVADAGDASGSATQATVIASGASAISVAGTLATFALGLVVLM